MEGLDLDGSVVLDALDHPALVVDHTDTIYEYNDTFEDFIDTTIDDGAILQDALARYPGLRQCVQQRQEDIVMVERDDETRYYQLSFSAVTSEDGNRIGELCLLYDVTTQQRKQRALERQNEQLDQFASLISHDLRNPLDVAIGRTTVLQELVDDPSIQDHLTEISESHERIRQIIQDVLTLARQGRSIDEKAEVPLAEIAREAWSHVDTDEVALTIETDQTVLADRKRLEQVFENLFRNSVEHAPTDIDTADGPAVVTVTVGELTDGGGFYVADDGKGIPKDERAKLFNAGYSGDDNTGLGLAIVSRIADAHGWDITATDSEAGGARFEFSGVESSE